MSPLPRFHRIVRPSPDQPLKSGKAKNCSYSIGTFHLSTFYRGKTARRNGKPPRCCPGPRQLRTRPGTSGTTTCKGDENENAVLRVWNSISISGELPQGTGPAFLLSLFRRPERKRNHVTREIHRAIQTGFTGACAVIFILYKERTPLPLQ
jgi:hypothetical protein